MPSLCVVPQCDSRTTGHRFPSDNNRKKVWLAKIRRDKFKPTLYSRVCKNHFLESDYEMPKVSFSENCKYLPTQTDMSLQQTIW